jgi:ubiquinone/menaquinone biosynthesis C-methylase UbiE
MNIDPLARWYRFVEYCAFGQALERRRFAYLNRLAEARRVLILGEGDGRLLARLLGVAREASIDVVELSGEMIALARARVGSTDRVRFLQEDARLVDFGAAEYDGVVTCFFLDCFPEAEAHVLVERLARALKPGGVWLVSDFAIPPYGWRRWHAAVWIWTMYRFFRITTGLQTAWLPRIERLLASAGLTRVEREEERAGMMVSELWRFSPSRQGAKNTWSRNYGA